jgi:hypothetical protein
LTARRGSAFNDAPPLSPKGPPLPPFALQIAARIAELQERVEALATPVAGPLVLIVPGLPGSELGKDGQKLWVDVAATREGRLLDLAYEAGAPPLDALGAIDLIYLQIQLRLRLSGHEVAVHPFDWRRPLPELGAELAARITAEGRQVHVVAHSVGGLVTRAAILTGAPNLGKVIMLGTPNRGTFTVVQGIRGQHWGLHLLSAVDGRHTAAELAARVFGTWPSVYAQLPVRGEPGALDLYDPASWPDEGPRPDPDLLRDAPAVQEWLAPSRGQFYLIAGYGLPTVDRVVRGGGGFEYLQTDGGDGWVPVRLATLDGYPTYYARCEHIGMPNDDAIIGAVEDLLARGATDRLPQALPEPPRDLPSSSDDTVLAPLFGGRLGTEIADGDIITVLADLLPPAQAEEGASR